MPVCEQGNEARQTAAKQVTDAQLVKVLKKLELTKPDRDKSRPLKTSLWRSLKRHTQQKTHLDRWVFNGAGFEFKTTAAPVVLSDKGAVLPVCEQGNEARQTAAKQVTDAQLVKVLKKLELTKPDRDKSRPLKTSLWRSLKRHTQQKTHLDRWVFNGAGEGIRTLDINLGKILNSLPTPIILTIRKSNR